MRKEALIGGVMGRWRGGTAGCGAAREPGREEGGEVNDGAAARRREPRQNDNFNPPSFFFLHFLPLSTTSGLCPPLSIFSSLLLPFTPPTHTLIPHSSPSPSLSVCRHHPFSPPAAVQRSLPRPPSGCQVTGTEALTSPPPRPTVSPPPLPWQPQQRPAELRLATRRLQWEEEEEKENA